MRTLNESIPTASTPAADAEGAYGFLVLACATTWLLALPAALAWMRHAAPPPHAVACAGLSAFGPTLAAVACAARRGRVREVFSRWRAPPAWIVLALLAPAAVHSVATALYWAAGGHPSQWFHPPVTPEQWAALVVFPLGEELGWRGFAHPRLCARHGLVKGSLILGAAWGIWHLMYSITPEAGGFDPWELGMTMAELPLYSLLIAWVFERTGRSMAVAIAFHAGAHLDHIEHAPRTDLRLHLLHLAVVAVLAVVAARSLRDRQRRGLAAS